MSRPRPTTSVRRAATGWAAAVILLVFACPLGMSPAEAQTPEAAEAQTPPEAAGLQVEELTGTVRPGGELAGRVAIRNPGAAPLADLRLTVVVEARATSRSEYRLAMETPAGLRPLVGRVHRALAAVAPGATREVGFAVPAADLGLGQEAAPAAGVYPLSLQLQGPGGVLDEARASIVVMTGALGEPVRTALLVPVDSPVGLLPDGRVRGDPLGGGLTEGGRLPELAAALAAAPDVPVTLATDALVLEELARAADGFTAVDAAGAVEVPAGAPQAELAAALLADVRGVLARSTAAQVALPYAAADLAGLVHTGQPEAARHAVREGVRRSAEATGLQPAPGVLWSPSGLDPRTLDAVAASGVETVVMGSDQVSDPDSSGLSPPAVRRLRGPDGSPITALVADPWLTDVLTSPGPRSPDQPGPAVVAQRVVGDLAALYFERPFADEPREALLVPPLLWDAPPGTAAALLESLADAAWVEPVTVPGLAAQVQAPASPARLRRSDDRQGLAPPGLSRAYLAALEDARTALDALTDVLTADGEQAAPADRLLQVAASVHYAGERAPAGRALIEAVVTAVRQVLTGVEVVEGPQIILTTRQEQVPVTVRNRGGLPVRVQVRLASPAFAFPGGAVAGPVTVPPGEQRLVDFTLQALRPGATSPVDVVVTDVGGERVLATGQLVVRSTAYSVTAVIITGGAGLFLAAWWLRDARRRRRGKATDGRRDRHPTLVRAAQRSRTRANGTL